MVKKLEELKSKMKWSDEELGDFIQEVAEAISNETTINLTTATKRELTEEMASRYLREIGLSANTKGFIYMKEALRMVYLKSVSSMSMTKELYFVIAKKFKTTPSRVERAMRYCIEKIFENPNEDMITEVFGFSVNQGKGRPTNSEFLSASAEFLKFKKF